MRTSSSSLDVRFANSEEVTGVQFSVYASAGLALKSVIPGPRTEKSSWMVDSYFTNDRMVNIVVLNINQQSFPTGSGTLASILFTVIELQDTNSIVLTNVMVTNKNGDSLGVIITNLEWNNDIISTTNTDHSNIFILGQNFPNPFNPSTVLTYRLNRDAQVRLSIYDITGREVTRLIDQYQSQGEYKVKWNSNRNIGQKLASGMYIARLIVRNSSVSRKLVLTQ